MTFSARYIIQSQGQAVLLTGVRWIGINRDRLGYFAATGDTRTPARVFTATVSIFVSSAPVPLALKGTPACVWEIRSVCVRLMSLSWRREETEGSGVMWTSTLGVCACACGDRERIDALVCIMERELSQLLGAFICLLQHQDTHALFLLAHRPNQTSCNLSFGCDLARQRWVTFSSWLYGNPSLWRPANPIPWLTLPKRTSLLWPLQRTS